MQECKRRNVGVQPQLSRRLQETEDAVPGAFLGVHRAGSDMLALDEVVQTHKIVGFQMQGKYERMAAGFGKSAHHFAQMYRLEERTG